MSKMEKVVRALPTEQEILAIRKADTGEWELTKKECLRVRARIYGINKNNAAGRRYRTMYDGKILIVVRFR